MTANLRDFTGSELAQSGVLVLVLAMWFTAFAVEDRGGGSVSDARVRGRGRGLWREDAEFVSFGVGHDDPRILGRPVRYARSGCAQSHHFGMLIAVVRSDVEMQPIFACFVVCDRLKQEYRFGVLRQS